MTANSVLKVTGLDYDEIKTNLKNFLRAQTKLEDYDYEGSNMAVLVDLLAYNTYMNGFYTNMIANEMFLDSALLRNNVIARAKMLGYRPITRLSPVATVTLQVFPTDAPATVSVAKGTIFTTSFESNTYNYVTDTAYTITGSSNTYTLAGVDIYEGSILTHQFTVVTANTDQRFILPNAGIDSRSLFVTIQTSDTDTETSTWTEADDLSGLTGTSKIYYLQETDNEELELLFGDGVLGKSLINGNIVSVEYRHSNGAKTNGATTFSVGTNVGGYANVTVTTTSNASGGASIESINSIKFNAPKAFAVQGRAVTETDYKRIIQGKWPQYTAIRVWGGEEHVPPQYGKVYLAIKPPGTSTITTERKNEIIAYLEKRNVVSIDPVFDDPEFMYIKPTFNINYNPTLTTRTEGELKTAVTNYITTYSSDNLEKFDGIFRYSKFVSGIDAVDSAIASTESPSGLDHVAGIRFTPTLNLAAAWTLNFNNTLPAADPGHVAHSGHAAVVTSTSFTKGGFTSFLKDDGGGILQIYYLNSDGDEVITDTTAGTVNYTTGQVILSSFNISAFAGDYIEVTAKLREGDVFSVRNQILQINEADISLTMVVDEN